MKKIFIVLTLFLLSSLFIGGGAFLVSMAEAKESFEIDKIKEVVDVKSYELAEGSKFSFSNAMAVENMEYGKKALGEFSLVGQITRKGNYRKHTAYGLQGDVAFSFKYDGSYQTDKAEDWNIISEEGTIVDDIRLSGSIAKGALIVQKSEDAYTWIEAAPPITNYFEDNKGGSINFYEPSGTDVARGMYYRVIFAYKMGRKTGTSGAWFWKKDIYECRECIEVYDFYLCSDTGIISLHNLGADVSSIETNEYTIEELTRGETLTDGSVSTYGFSVDKLGTTYLVEVSRNGSSPEVVEDGATFTEEGLYTVTSMSKLGTTITQKIYVFGQDEDRGYRSYFDGNIVQGRRVFRYSDYPSYAKGSYIKIKKIDDNIPPIRGQVIDAETDTVVLEFDGNTRKEQQYSLKAGVYKAVMLIGQNNAGSVVKYEFKFNIIDEEALPYVNYYNFQHSERLMDLKTKHYEVAYHMTAGGYIFVCFSLDSYDEAVKYAYDIEKRFVEKSFDGTYYKSMENPNIKVKYVDNIALTAALNYYAEQNVEINYFNPTDEFTYRTFQDDLLAQLESINEPNSIKVFPNEEEREKMSDVRYLNDFQFVKVEDYDVVKVEAYCHNNGVTIPIEFGRNVSEQLSLTSYYTIIETNIYDLKRTYDAYFVQENQSVAEVALWTGDSVENCLINYGEYKNDTIELYADSLIFNETRNQYDDQTIVTIKAPNVYTFELKCLLSEIEGLGLYKKGDYELTFIDRTSHLFRVKIKLSGKDTLSDVISKNAFTYSELYNNLFLNDRASEDEGKASEIDTLIEQLKDEINSFPSVDAGLYTSESYNRLSASYQAAVWTIANAPNESLQHVKSVLDEYRSAFAALVPIGNKENLGIALSRAKAVDCSKFTPLSVEALNTVYNAAYKVFNDEEATQAEIDMAIAALQEKMAELALIADHTQLLHMLEQITTIDTNKYTTATIKQLKENYDRGLTAYKSLNCTQTEVDALCDLLQESIGKLEPCGDRSALDKILEEISGIPYMLYEKDGILELLDAYNAINNGERDTQEVIDLQFSYLQAKCAALVKRDDKTMLYEALQRAASLNLRGYDEEGLNEFKEIYDRNLAILYSLNSSSEEVRIATEEINNLSDLYEQSLSVPWWEILIISLCVLVLTAIASIIIGLKFNDDVIDGWIIALCIILAIAAAVTPLVCLLIFCSWLSWWILLISAGVLLVTFVAELLIEFLINEVW